MKGLIFDRAAGARPAGRGPVPRPGPADGRDLRGDGGQPVLRAAAAARHRQLPARLRRRRRPCWSPLGQLGYAAGLLLVVPIGDIVRRRPLLTGLLAVDTLALAASAVAPNLQLLGSLAVVVGVTSVVVQMLVPYAATLAPDDAAQPGDRHADERPADRHPAVPHVLRRRRPAGRVAGGVRRRGRVHGPDHDRAAAGAARPRPRADGQLPRADARRAGRGPVRAGAALAVADRGLRVRRVRLLLDHGHVPAVRAAVRLLTARHRAVRTGRGGRSGHRRVRRPAAGHPARSCAGSCRGPRWR